MKKLFSKNNTTLFTLLCLLAISFVACNKDSIAPASGDLTELPSDVKTLLGELGHNPCAAQDVDGGYVTEEGVFFEDETIEGLLNGQAQATADGEVGERSRATSQFLVLPDGNEIFNYFIDPSLGISPLVEGQSWIDAIEDAAQDWNAIGYCDVTPIRVFSLIPAGTNGVNILRDNSTTLPASMRNLAPGTLGLACSSNGVRTGRFISVNNDATGYVAHIERVNTIRRFLGFAIGFRPNHPESNFTDNCGTSVTNNVIDGTLSNDAASIMRPGIVADATFSTDDVKGARALYPLSCETPQIIGAIVKVLPSGSKVIEASVNTPGGIYMDMRLQASGPELRTNNFKQVGGPVTNGKYTVGVLTPGVYNVTATVRNYRGDCMKASNTISVTVP